MQFPQRADQLKERATPAIERPEEDGINRPTP